jgi:hypothetical protein
MRVGPSMQEVIGPGLPLTRTSLEQINSGLAMPMTASPDIEIRPFAERDRKAVIALWHLCELTRPWNDPDTDIDLATACPSSTILVGEHEGAIIASAMVGFDSHRGWVYYRRSRFTWQGAWPQDDVRRRSLARLMRRTEGRTADQK